MSSISAGFSFPVVCLVSYPAAAAEAAAVDLDWDQSFLYHARQTGLRGGKERKNKRLFILSTE